MRRMNEMSCFSVCSVTRGQNHLHNGRPCDDAVFTAIAGNCRAVAVSDGAGSRNHAALGAAAASKMAALFVSEEFENLYSLPRGEAGSMVLYIVQRTLGERAEELGCSLRDLGCTLLVCAVHDDGRSLNIHIGDGSIERLERNGSVSVVSDYEHEEAENVTELITSASPHVKERKSDRRSIFMLRTDGTEPVLSGALCRLFFSLAVLLPEEKFRQVCTEMFVVPDDSTVAVIGDLTCMDNVISATDTTVLSKLLGMSRKAVMHRRSFYGRVLRAAAVHPCTIGEIMRLCRQHGKYRTIKKLRPLIDCGLLQYRNGFFRMEK